MNQKSDYGIDAPGVIRNLILIGVGMPLLGWFVPALHLGPVTILIRPAAVPAAVLCLLEAALMIIYSKSGKFRHRDRMLKMVDWKGDATAMNFANGSFDVVVSNLCLHNIPTRDGRDRACREIVRVLKPGGKAVI